VHSLEHGHSFGEGSGRARHYHDSGIRSVARTVSAYAQGSERIVHVRAWWRAVGRPGRGTRGPRVPTAPRRAATRSAVAHPPRTDAGGRGTAYSLRTWRDSPHRTGRTPRQARRLADPARVADVAAATVVAATGQQPHAIDARELHQPSSTRRLHRKELLGAAPVLLHHAVGNVANRQELAAKLLLALRTDGSVPEITTARDGLQVERWSRWRRFSCSQSMSSSPSACLGPSSLADEGGKRHEVGGRPLLLEKVGAESASTLLCLKGYRIHETGGPAWITGIDIDHGGHRHLRRRVAGDEEHVDYHEAEHRARTMPLTLAREPTD